MSSILKFVGILVIGIAFIPSVASAATYYVDATIGNNSNNGTSTSTPWLNLTKVNGTTFSPGDTVLFKRGDTFAGRIVVSQTGSAGNPITFGAFGEGARPIINASGNTQGVQVGTNKSYIVIEGLEVRNASTNQMLLFSSVNHITIDDCAISGSTGAGISISGPGPITDITISSTTASGYTGSGRILQFYTSGTAFENILIDHFTAPSGTGSLGLLFSSGLTLSNIDIIDSTFSGQASDGILFNSTSATDVTLQNVITNGNAGRGLIFLGTTVGIAIDNHTAVSNSHNGLEMATTTNAAILNSTFDDNTRAGISIIAPATNMEIDTVSTSGNGFQGISAVNAIDGFLGDAITSVGNDLEGIEFTANTGTVQTGISVTNSQFNENGDDGFSLGGLGTGADATISGTEASGNTYDGFNVHYGWTDVIFDDDDAEDNGTVGLSGSGDGFSFHETSSGIIRNSTARNNLKTAVAQVGTASTTMYNNVFSHDTSGTLELVTLRDGGHHTLFNNVFYTPTQTGTAFSSQGTTTSVFMNNIVYGFEIGIEALEDALVTEDYNIAYGAGADEWSGLVQGAHSLSADPDFVSAADLDFALLGTSPAINAGTASPYETDRAGNTRVGITDIGVYEFQGTPADTRAPTIAITTPLDDATVAGTVPVTADASDNVGIESVQFYLNGVAFEAEDAVNPYSIAWDTTTRTDGLYILLAVARDAEGNFATSTAVTVAVSNDSDAGNSRGHSGQTVHATSNLVATSTVVAAASSLPTNTFLSGVTGEAVRQLQLLLISLGYAIPAGATGYFGPQTQAALALYQASVTPPSQGQPSILFTRPLSLGSTGTDVVMLQRILMSKGFYRYPEITGYYGPLTLQAVADFQRSVGLDHLGYVGPATRAMLNTLPR